MSTPATSQQGARPAMCCWAFPSTESKFLPRRYSLLELLDPVQHDVYLRPRKRACFSLAFRNDHDQLFPVLGDVVVAIAKKNLETLNGKNPFVGEARTASCER